MTSTPPPRHRTEPPHWQIRVDTGGTFTDCLALDPGGRVHRVKVLSNSSLRGEVGECPGRTSLRLRGDSRARPGFATGFRLRLLGDVEPGIEVLEHAADGTLHLASALPPPVQPGVSVELLSPHEAPVLAARLVTGTPAGQPLPPLSMRLATTRGTNALLQRNGGPVALFTTRGFGDVLRIGTQQRPDLFALNAARPRPLTRFSVEVHGRIAADGAELEPLRLDLLRDAAGAVLDAGVTTAAVALVNSYRNPAHERVVGEALLDLGFRHVSLSAEIAPIVQLFPRAQTAAVDGYLAEVIRGYLDRVAEGLSAENLPAERGARPSVHVMTSAGGLVRSQEFRASDSLLSGPAAGVVGAARAGRRSGLERVIAFDMGGTSTDVARLDGDFEYSWSHEVGDVRLLAPALAIRSVAAGGGSVCTFDSAGLRVGPESAGALPGPACYGAGGPLTVTDVNLLLGRLDPAWFDIPIDLDAARRALAVLGDRIAEQTPGGETPEGGATPPAQAEALLQGLLEIADERMAEAIRGISVREGYDPADYALVAFGGAGGQHACGVAERLGIGTVLVPADASLLSAVGLGHAAIERFAQRQVLQPLARAETELPALDAELVDAASRALAREGVEEDEVVVRRRIANLRFVGQESTLAIDYEPGQELASSFSRRYQEVYGHLPGSRDVELESLRVIASCAAAPIEPAAMPAPTVPKPCGEARCFAGDGWRSVPVLCREDMCPGAEMIGPLLVREQHSSTYVPPEWRLRVDGVGGLLLSRMGRPAPDAPASDAPAPDAPARDAPAPRSGDGLRRPAPVVEELFTSRFQAIAGQMGDQLQRTALSTNIKERLDFSCALLDPDGELVVNAPHIPVHLGALGLCVRAVREALPLGPGDVAITNHPGYGGSHLPDVTVITPVHTAAGELVGYAANRAHHAEIGGSRPGSMPPGATSLEEEGVVIPPTLIVQAGHPKWDVVEALLRTSRYPSRDPQSNLADLRAQVAANHMGGELLRTLAGTHGHRQVLEQMAALKRRAGRGVVRALGRMRPGSYRAEEMLDDGSPLRVDFRVERSRAVVDFTGSAAVHPGNLNATPAIVRSAVLYVLRLLVDEEIPLNEGLMGAVELRVPAGLLNPDFSGPPASCPAVVGGNTEVSQRLVDTLLRALNLAACSQGTMNNVLWGDHRFGFYETIAGGAGAGPGWHGESGVHSHMTNTRITDVEVMEHRYAVRVERFALRRGSGGSGLWRGGDGVIREIRFLAPVSLSVLTQHRVQAPYGMAGGSPGAVGRQQIIRSTGEVVELAPSDASEVLPGDLLRVETPGGGGWGKAE